MLTAADSKKRLRVAFDVTPIFKDERGIGRYSRELLNRLSRLCDVVPCHAGSRSPTKREWQQQYFRQIAGADGMITEARHLPGSRLVQELWRRNHPDVVLFPSIHWAPAKPPRNSVVVIHDVIPLIFPDLLPKPAEEWRNVYRRTARRARMIVTVSESSAEDISKYLQISPARIVTIYGGISRLPVDEAYPVPVEPYFVAVGAADKHKNTETLVDAMRLLRDTTIKLYVVGRDDLGDYARRRRVQDKVVFTGRVSDAALGSLIKGAAGFVFPSLYEGFGLPPLEAAALGCPVISSFRPAMNAVLRGVAMFVEAKDAGGWARAMEALVANPSKRQEMSIRARQLAERYCWEDTAEKIVSLLSQVAGKQEG